MVKHLFLLLFFLLCLKAKGIQSVVKDIIGPEEYSSKKKLIEIIFQDNDYFFDDGSLDYIKILEKLESENLLKIQNKNTASLKIAFSTSDHNLQIFLKVIKDTLFSLGFNNFYTIKAIKNFKEFVWIVSLGNNYTLDPLIFAKKLREKNVFISDMKRYSLTNWNYVLNIKNATIVTTKYPFDQEVQLTKSMRSYWLNLQDCKKITIKSYPSDSWHPYIVLYTKNLNIIKTIKKNRVIKEISINIPLDAKYLKIDDLYTLKNIKNGFKIYLTKRK